MGKQPEKSVDPMDSERLTFADEDSDLSKTTPEPGWNILIVDDEPAIHATTRRLLEGITFENKGLNFISAYSGQEARQILATTRDIALILLDVVMETEDSGLNLVRFIRNELKNKMVRIILRTGNPGQAPEKQVIFDFDINDYKLKSMLTDQGLYTTVITALRNYRDLKEIRAYAEKIKASEKRYRTLFNSAADAIFIHDLDGHILDVNPVGCRLLEYPSETLKSMTIDQIEYPQWADEPARIKPNRFSQEPSLYPAIFQTRDGRCIPVEANARLIDYDNSQVVMIIARDIRERIQAEQEKQKLQEQLFHTQKFETIGVFASGIAHDLNNLLFPMMGCAQMALDDVPESSEAYQNIQQILTAVKRASEITNQILVFGKESKTRSIPVKLGPIVEESIGLINAIRPATVSIQRQLDPEPLWIQADPSRIHQILMNLCTNAIHAMADTGGTLTVRTNRIHITDSEILDTMEPLNPGPYVQITIQDTGHGMTPDILSKIFDPYFSTKTPDKGTGMGLSVVHGIVRQYQGSIHVSSTPGLGSTFIIYLPAIEPDLLASDTPTSPPAHFTGNESILIIDDDVQVVQMLTRMLGRLGYRVAGESHPKKGLNRFKQTPDAFDLMIVNQNMPSITGLDLSKKVLKIRKEMSIVICSGFRDALDSQQARKLGIRDLIPKPIDRIQLAKTIRQILDQQKRQILVIDDEPGIRTVLRKILQRAGYEVVEAEDGEEGIEKFHETRPDLLIVDLILPGKKGVDVIYEITADYPSAKMIAITGGGDYGPEALMHVAVTAKNTPVPTLAKPIDAEVLIRTVRDVLMDTPSSDKQ